MLYIKFEILDPAKFPDYQKLHNHLVSIRQPGFEFEYKASPEIDWENLTDEEAEEELNKLTDYLEQSEEAIRYATLIPSYAHVFLKRYTAYDNEKLGALGKLDVYSLWNYLEYGFEVNIDNLEKLSENMGVIEVSTGNFPYGGVERFIIVLKAFDLVPLECFDGFTVFGFDWKTDFEYDTTNHPEKTEEYLKKSNS